MERVKEVGLTPDQFTVLRWTHSVPRNTLSQSKLSKLMSTDQNNISALVKRMENLNLLDRKISMHDKRSKTINFTDLGNLKYTKAKCIADSLEREILDEMVLSERKIFFRTLSKLSENIKGKLN
ncbi:MAG: winged helix-turn-helix transcriptional regulator [Opitutae bacterium]|jgi:DNA-binding MarR family transcriptional regulator|nr:winged helix-turn-helix transcriptional regulator [Opitutae bacterium]